MVRIERVEAYSSRWATRAAITIPTCIIPVQSDRSFMKNSSMSITVSWGSMGYYSELFAY